MGSSIFTASRDRAILVRLYLQTHFHLDVKNIGVVALRDLPPPGLHKDKWVASAWLRTQRWLPGRRITANTHGSLSGGHSVAISLLYRENL
jgi:hypothetical protein